MGSSESLVIVPESWRPGLGQSFGVNSSMIQCVIPIEEIRCFSIRQMALDAVDSSIPIVKGPSNRGEVAVGFTYPSAARR